MTLWPIPKVAILTGQSCNPSCKNLYPFAMSDLIPALIQLSCNYHLLTSSFSAASTSALSSSSFAGSADDKGAIIIKMPNVTNTTHLLPAAIIADRLVRIRRMTDLFDGRHLGPLIYEFCSPLRRG